MADLTSLLSSLSSSSASSSSSSQTAADLLVQSYKAAQQPRIDVLTSKQKNLETRRTFFNTLKSKINALISNIDNFTASDANSKFQAKKAASSDSTVLTATAKGEALLGVNQLKVSRLATNDILASNQLSLSGSFGIGAGTSSFDLTIDGTTKTISVDFTGTETNEQALSKIANAINNTEDIEISASVIKDTGTTGRLTLTSKETGSGHKITFSDSAVLTQLGITSALNPGTTARTVLTDTLAGYNTADYNTLDSRLSINGINVTRGSNTIDDLLTGVTLTLLKPQEDSDLPVTLTNTVNDTAVQDLVKPFLNNFNDLLSYLKSNASLSRSDSTINSLYSRVRSIASQAVTSVNSGDPKYLPEIGIKIGSDGTLSIGDADKLKDWLETDPLKVANLFTSSDGFAAKINEIVSDLTGDQGLIQSRTLSLNKQIDSTSTRTKELEARIDTQAENLRREYEDMLNVYLQAQSQMNMLSAFQG